MKRGVPFVGRTGEEMKRFFNGDELPLFDEVFRSNIYREWKGKDAEYDDTDFKRDEPFLLQELRDTQPQIVVAIGRHATRYFLGDVSMDEVHGLPWHLPLDSRAQVAFDPNADGKGARNTSKTAGRGTVRPIVFCCYHPAAGFRSPEASALVSYDFAQLALFANGELTPRKLHDDPIPNPQYFHVQTMGAVEAFRAISTIKKIYSDSEGYARKPWSVQWAAVPGTGYLIKAEHTEVLNRFLEWVVKGKLTVVFHNSLHDRSVFRAMARLCGWSEERILFELDQVPFQDTMVMAYLLQLEPQNLKGLATRHANMAMMSYDELMGDKQNEIARDHLFRMWDILYCEYEQAQQKAFERINTTPLLDKKTGKVKVGKDGQIKMRRTTVLPAVPKSDLFKAVERCCRAKEPARLYADQREDVLVEGYNLVGDMVEATLDDVDFATALTYGCRDADATSRVEPELSQRLAALKLKDVYNLELSTYPLIDRMMTVGMRPNLDVFAKLSEKLHYEIVDLQVAIEQATGVEGFNANSGDQVAAYLFDSLGLTPLKMTTPSDKKEARGSTNDKILETLEKEHGHEHPVISLFRNYREVYKLKHTFVDRVPDFTHRYPFDGRIHATFRTTRVITGRLAASDPNVLAQPEHGKFAKDFKAGWEAEPGHVVCNWDLSQVELRVLAHLSGDPVLRGAYGFKCVHSTDWQSGKTICKRDECVLVGDLHAKLAHQVFGVKPSQQDDSRHRLPAKTHNFGLAMGMTCHGLMIELRKNGVEVDEEGAQEWIDASNKLYKKVPHYKAEKIAEARRNGFVRCLSGRIRYIGGIRSHDERLRSEAERFAFSTPIQEGAQRSMKEAEAYIWKELLVKKYYREGYYKGGSKGQWVEPLCQVHDALRFEIAEHLVFELHKEISYAMTKVPTQLTVPLAVEGKYGPNLRDTQKFK